MSPHRRRIVLEPNPAVNGRADSCLQLGERPAGAPVTLHVDMAFVVKMAK